MSAYLCILKAHRVELLTDAAVLDRQARLVRVKSKVAISKDGRAAVTVRGESLIGNLVSAVTRSMSASELISRLPTALMECERVAETTLGDRSRHYEIAVCCYRRGPEVFFLAGHDLHQDQIRHRLERISAPVFGAPTPDSSALAGFAAPADPEDFKAERHGVDYVEAMRRSRAELPFGSGSHHIVGGFLELTTLDQAGARQRIVRSWQDRLGEPITPGPRR